MLRKVALASIALATSVLAIADAGASAQRTFVAASGNDANPCSLSAPCRSFAAAITQANPSGEVIVLDSAGYGPVTITKSVSILAPSGMYAGVSVSSGVGIDVNGSAINVVLRGLTVNGQGGHIGVRFSNGARLHIESCEISGFTGLGNSGVGIDAPGSDVYVNDTTVRDNQNGLVIAAQSSANAVLVTISRSRFEANTTEGIILYGAGSLTIEDSVIARSAYNVDVYTLPLDTVNVHVSIARTLIERGTYGVYLEPNSSAVVYAYVTDSTVTRNTYGVAISPFAGATGIDTWITRTHVVRNGLGVTASGSFGPTYVFLDSSSVDNGLGDDIVLSNNAILYTRQNSTVGNPIVVSSGAEVVPYVGQ